MPVEASARRKAFSFALASPDFEPPALRGSSDAIEGGALPPLSARLALISFTLVAYHHTQPITTPLRRLVLLILEEHAGAHLRDDALCSRRNHFGRNLLTIASEVEGDASAQMDERLAVRAVLRYLDGCIDRLGVEVRG